MAGIAVVLAAASPGATADGSAGKPIGPFVIVATGGQDRVTQTDDHSTNPRVHRQTTTKASYRATLSVLFTVDPSGTISGTGQGSYLLAAVDRSGVNGAQGPFACDPVVQVPPSFEVDVRGDVYRGIVELRLRLVGAVETTPAYDCGAGVVVAEALSHYLSSSLDTTQSSLPDGRIRVKIAQSRRDHLSGRAQQPVPDGVTTIDSAWDVAFHGPSPITDANDRGGLGPSPGSARSALAGRAAICTIVGTPRRDRLQGTAGNDVICGFDGNDRIDARGGNDTVFGGRGDDSVTGGGGRDVIYGDTGHDRLSARDGSRDTLDGGRGKDRVRSDKRLDRVRAAERR